MNGKALSDEDQAVRGVLVKGLTGRHIEMLDDFEGDVSARHPELPSFAYHLALQEYTRKEVKVLPHSPLQPFKTVDPNGLLSKAEALPTKCPTVGLESAFVYVWDAPIDRLSPEIWSYDTFVRENIWQAWANTDANRPDPELMSYTIAPEGGEGILVPVQTAAPKTKFGHAVRKYFNFAEGYVNLNNGKRNCGLCPVWTSLTRYPFQDPSELPLCLSLITVGNSACSANNAQTHGIASLTDPS